VFLIELNIEIWQVRFMWVAVKNGIFFGIFQKWFFVCDNRLANDISNYVH